MKGLDMSFSKVVIRGGWLWDRIVGCQQHQALKVVAGSLPVVVGWPFQVGDHQRCLVVVGLRLEIPVGVTGG